MPINKAECRKFLIKSIENILVPKLLSEGFELFPLSKEDKKSEMRYRVPFGTLKKDVGIGVVLVEILFYPNGDPKFVIDFAVAPKANIKLPNGKCLASDQIHVSALPDRYCLYYNKFLSMPFGYGFFSKGSEEVAIKMATRASDLYKEIENFVEYGKIGKHIRKEISFVGNKLVFCDENDEPTGVE